MAGSDDPVFFISVNTDCGTGDTPIPDILPEYYERRRLVING